MNDSEYDVAIARAAQDALAAQEDAPKDVLDEVPAVPEGELPVDPEKAQLRQKAELYDAYVPMLERLGKGELVITEAPPPVPDPTPVFEYRQRITSPDAPAVIEEMKLYQEQLKAVDPEAAQRLDDDPVFFVETYDKLRSLRPPPAQPTPTAPRRDSQELEKIINARESRKDSARGISAGVSVGSETYGVGQPITPRDAEVARLKREIRKSPTDSDLAVALAKALGLGES